MILRHSRIRFALLLFVLLVYLLASRPAVAAEPAPTRRQVQAALQRLPLTFEANQGQTDRRVQFLARGQGYHLFLTSTEAVLVLRKAEKPSLTQRRKDAKKDILKLPGASVPVREAGRNVSSSVLRMKLVGANPHPKASGQERMLGQVNYFLGNDPRKWRTNVPTFKKVRYNAVYPGIDLVYYGNPQQLEYDFVVQPGANPKKIALSFAGVQRVRIDRRGELVLKTVGREVRWHKPVVYQQIHGKHKSIAAKYVLHDAERRTQNATRITFQVARYDTTRPLIIDPTFAYSTYLGGSGGVGSGGIAVDAAGYVYVTGGTDSHDFPTRNAYQGELNSSGFALDAFVTKLDTTKSGDASLVYSTYLGGREHDSGTVIAVDTAGYVYVAGWTQGRLPTRNAFQGSYQGGDTDAFLAKLDLTQSGAAQLLYSTYLGGSGAYGDYPSGIAAGAAGIVHVTGATYSSNFPTRNAFQGNYKGVQDAFVTKLDTTKFGAASLLYSTYLGGSDQEYSTGIAMDSAGNVYVTGTTTSTDFPTRNAYKDHGSYDAFVTKLDTMQSGAASLLYSTYLGGSTNADIGHGIAVDGMGYAYVTGVTWSSDFPTRNPYMGDPDGAGQSDVFVTKLDTTQSGAAQLLYSTYLGGSGGEEGAVIAVDTAGYVYLTGRTGSTDFPTWNAYQGNYHGGYGDVYVTKLDITQSGAAQLLYSTYLGGSNQLGGKGEDIGGGIAVDGAGNIYVSGYTDSRDFPTRNAYQDSFQGGSDAFVTRFAPDVLSEATVTGRITLEDCLNPLQPVTFTFRPTDGASSFSQIRTLNADGTFTLPHLLRKNYLLALKGARWLQKVVSVNASNGNVTDVTAILKAGDANNDNSVDVLDLDALIQAFDAVSGAPNWNEGVADFNCDGSVDVLDLDLLIRNFDQTGDP